MNKAVRGAVGSLKHEGIYLTPEEKALLTAYAEGRITEEEYDRQVRKMVEGDKNVQSY